MITVSLCMIVRNEEQVLERCLKSISFLVDEIIIVDTGSVDRTKEIAALFTDKIYDFTWINDFAAARNFAYSHATKDYQMWLDADDVFPEMYKDDFLNLKKTLNPDTDMVTMKYHTHFDADGNPILTSTRERLTKREKNFKWLDPVHECIALQGTIFPSNITIHHLSSPSSSDSRRNLDIYESLERSGAELSPRQQYYFARELKDHMQFSRAAAYFEQFLEGKKGWIEDNIGSCLNLAVCYRALGKTEKILPVLIQSFNYDSPRPDICCQIGYYYMEQKQFAIALNWFQVAARMDEPSSLGFVAQDFKDYIPQIESCVCCSELGQFHQARIYNEKAALAKPENPSVLHNRKFLDTVLGSSPQ